MKYDEALKRWGAAKARFYGTDDWRDIKVDLQVDPGYACCGGTDPDCYCSYAESPSIYVGVKVGYREVAKVTHMTFLEVLKEILEVADGSISK